MSKVWTCSIVFEERLGGSQFAVLTMYRGTIGENYVSWIPIKMSHRSKGFKNNKTIGTFCMSYTHLVLSTCSERVRDHTTHVTYILYIHSYLWFSCLRSRNKLYSECKHKSEEYLKNRYRSTLIIKIIYVKSICVLY